MVPPRVKHCCAATNVASRLAHFEHLERPPVKRLISAPNLALATLWADLLSHAGVPTTVQRQYASSIAGEVPPDQTLPELWVREDEQLEQARTLLQQLRHPPVRHWVCPGCRERIDGPFEQCWNCGASMPAWD
jgi:hypothetical protein